MPQIFKKFLRQMSGGELGGEKHDDSRRGRGLVQNSVGGYQRVPSNGTISTSTTSASLIADYDPQHHKSFTPSFPVEEEDNNQSPDEEEDFERTRLYFQQNKQISIDSAKKFKLEMDEKSDNKSENIRNTVPFVTQISTDRIKKDDFSINRDGSPYRPTTQKINFQSQLQAAIAVSLGSMVVGFTTAYTSPGLASMLHENSTLTITKAQGSWVGGLMPLAALVGGLLGGFMIVHLGRRNTIMATAIPFIASWITIAEAPTVYVVYIGRALGGLCVGIGSLAFPVYLGEALQAEVRGQLGLLPTALGNIGILLCFIAGKYLDWSLLAYMGAFLPLPFMLLTMLIPETPHWYISKGNQKEAEKSLEKLRGKDADINNELNDIIKSHQETKENENSSIWDLFRSENRRPVMISLGLMFFQQMSGINAVIFYTVSIFQSAGSTIDENWCTIIVGIVNFGATFVATFLIDRLGRKMLLYISSLSMIVMLGVLGTFFFMQSLEYNTSAYGWLPLISFVIYVIGFSLGFGPIPWLMMGEILPGRVKGSAASVATAFNWTCTFIVTKTFQDLIDGIGTYGAFWLFGVVCIFGFIFTIIFVPETKGKSLEDIEKQLSRKK